MNLFLLAGVGCSGKTAIAKAVAKIAPEVVVIPSGEWKRDIIDDIPGLRESFESWHELNQEQTDLVNRRFYNEIISDYSATDKTVLVETHLVYRHDYISDRNAKYNEEHSFVNVVDNDMLAATNGIILVDTPLKEIIERRKMEINLNSTWKVVISEDKIEQISEERSLEEMRAMFAREAFRTPVMKIHSYPSKCSTGTTIPSVDALARIAVDFIQALIKE